MRFHVVSLSCRDYALKLKINGYILINSGLAYWKMMTYRNSDRQFNLQKSLKWGWPSSSIISLYTSRLSAQTLKNTKQRMTVGWICWKTFLTRLPRKYICKCMGLSDQIVVISCTATLSIIGISPAQQLHLGNKLLVCLWDSFHRSWAHCNRFPWTHFESK